MGNQNTSAGKIDTTPRKRILWTSVAVCSPKNAITELQDNIIDYVAERLKQGKLNKITIKSSFNLNPDGVNIKWNLGIPKERRLALLTPGLHVSDDDETVGTWSLGGKIAIHALGDDITIRTCVPDDDAITIYKYPSGWLRDLNGGYNDANDTDWNILQSFEDIEDSNDFTEINIKNTAGDILRDFDKKQEETYFESMNNVLKYVGETYGLTFERMNKHVIFDMQINGEKVKPITYSSHDDIKSNLIRVPGFEPTTHKYSIKGLKIQILVGCTPKIDVANGGMYFYGNNNRLFASRERNIEYLNNIDVTHPYKKSWQMHIFFSGDTQLIPWSSPLKNTINYSHPTMLMLKPILNKLPLPYIELVIRTHAPERFVFSEKYLQMSEDERKHELFGLEPNKDNLWESLPEIAKKGREYSDEMIEMHDHGDLIASQRERTNKKDPKWTISLTTSFLKSNQITAKNTKSIDGKIKALWAFNKIINPTEDNLMEISHKKATAENIPIYINTNKPLRLDSKANSISTMMESSDDISPKEGTSFDSNSIVQRNIEDDVETISSKVQKKYMKHLETAAHSKNPTDIMDFLVELLFLTQNLLESPNIPENIRSQNGIEKKMEALIDHFGGKLKE